MTEIDLTPITRLEYDIDAILNDHAVAEPITRIELILADIVAGNTTTVVPVTRIETYLAIISGADYPVPEPVTRIETFLAIIAGEDYEEPEAVTRLEGLLAEWVEKGSGIWKTVTGALIHLTDALASPVKELSATIEPQQSGSGDPSPENVRPITGWTGCEVKRTGANLFDNSNMIPSMRIDAGVVGAHSSYNLFVVPVKENTQYTFNQTGVRTGYPIFAQSNKYPESGDTVYNQTNIRTNDTFTFNSGNYKYALFALYKSAGTTFSVATGTIAIPIDTPYSGTTISVTFPDSAGTVYGGTVDLVSGLLTVDRGIITYNGSDITLEYGSFYGMPCKSATISNFKQPSSSTSLVGIKSNYLKEIKQASTWGVVGTFSATTVDSRLYICIDSSIDSQNALNQYLAEHPLTFCYELAEPITIQLTPQEISTLAGENNVWSNSNGDTTIIYKAQAE